LFACLSVFAGAFTLEAAEAVCAGDAVGGGAGIEKWEVLDLLTALVDKSLVVAEHEVGEPVRYRLLETSRQYGRDRLADAGADAAVWRRYRDHYLALAERAGPLLQGPEQERWLAELEQEHDNLRAALARTLADGGADAGLRLAGALGHFWRS